MLILLITEFLVQESLERSKLVRSQQPFNSTCLPTMTMDASLEAPSDGKYKPTSSSAQTITLSHLSFIAESPNENEADLVEIQHKLRFEADSKMSVLTILKLFLEQLMLLDSHAYLLSKDTSRHFQNVQDLPTLQSDLQKLFPATILHRRSGNRIVLRLTVICSKTFLELTRLGIITWANRNHIRLEDDIYLEDDVRDCLWIAGRDSYTSKPHLHEYLTNILKTTALSTDEQHLLQAYNQTHNLTDEAFPSFSIHFRNRVTFKKLSTQALIIRCDATIGQFFVKFLTRANTSGTIPIKKGSFIPLAVTKHNEKATISAMDLQNKYLTRTVSLPVIGLSFESLQNRIDVEGEGMKTIETLLYENCLSVEPTSKSADLGRFNLICFHTDESSLINYIETDFPMMWKLLPTDVASKFSDKLKIDHPRLTSGFTGVNVGPNSVTINDPQSISQSVTSQSESDNQWTKPPKIRRPPPFVSVIYNETASQTNRRTRNENKSRTSSTKSQTTSDMSTMVSDLRDDVAKEFKEHAEILSTLRNEIAQLRTLHTTPVNDILSEIKAVNNQEVTALRTEIASLETKRHSNSTQPIADIQEIVTKIVQNMVPLIIATVRENMTPPIQHDHPKRLRAGSTPTHLKIFPTNLMSAYPPDSPMDTALPSDQNLSTSPTPNRRIYPPDESESTVPSFSIDVSSSPTTPNSMLTPATRKGETMEE